MFPSNDVPGLVKIQKASKSIKKPWPGRNSGFTHLENGGSFHGDVVSLPMV